MSEYRPEIPFDDINAAALVQLASLLRDWLPNGRRVGHEWRVGSINGEAGDSFSVNMQSGRWAEFNGLGETGGDVIGLYAAKFCRGNRVEAALDLARKLGIEIKRREPPKPKTKPKVKLNDDQWVSLIPPPPDVGPPGDPMLSGFDILHCYTSADGRETHFVGRIEARGGERKKFIPITYGELKGKRGWRKRAPNPPRPLYGLSKLKAMPKAPVILCEGEKSADAAQGLFPDYACISWFGGVAQVKHADLGPLANRSVIVWPDADASGLNAMRTLIPRLPADTQVVCTDGLPKAFDAADLERQGCNDPAAWLNGRLRPAHEFRSDGPSSGDAAEPAPVDDAARFDTNCEVGKATVYGDKLDPEAPRQPDDQPGATKINDQGPTERDGQEATASPEPSVQQRPAVLILPPPAAPLEVARCFVEGRCLHNGSAEALTVRYWCGCWWTWRTTHWVETQPHTMRSLLYKFTGDAAYFDAEGELRPWSPTRNKISDLLEALSARVVLSDDFEQPCWIDGRQTGPIVATTNGLLDVASLQLHPHSPFYFGQVSVPFPYDPGAPTPTKWLDFLNALWPNEIEPVDVLGEWFGYVISGRLDLHKIFVMVGPTRGGKGVIARILTALIGKRSVCGPTLSSFGGEFGLQPLLGKSLAIISDARSGGGKSSSVVVERLLSISGEDTLTVNRKYRDQWSGKLSVRLHIISNELPRLGDASSAIVGRLVLLLTTRSWLGKENFELEAELRTELTGILNWSLQGLRRLTLDNENHFTRSAAADEATRTMQDLASPVGAFVRERCKLGAEDEIPVDDLFDAYKTWCEHSEYRKSPKAHFGRDLRAACPSVRKRRPRDGSKRHFVYGGIRLRKDVETEEEADEEERPL
jgi:putative DNA primase/helicase